MSTCRICYEEFTEGNSTVYCPKDHYLPCRQCGEEFLVKKVVQPPEFCSPKCSAVFRVKSNTFERVCKLCGELFDAPNPNSRFCGKKHLKECKKCGEEFEVVNPYKMKEFCSRKCSMGAQNSLKECEWCGEPFTPKRKDSRFCEGPHGTACKGCGGEIKIKEMKRIPSYCSAACSSRNHLYTVVCTYCGESFASKKKDAKFCDKPHHTNCENCGKTFVVRDKYNVARFCSNECVVSSTDYDARNSKSRVTIQERYGVDYASQVDAVKKRKKNTYLSRYFAENPGLVEEFKEKRRLTNLERYGVENGGGAPEVQERIRKTNLEKYGVENVFQVEAVKERIKEVLLERYGVENAFLMAKARENALKASGRRVSKINREWAAKLSALFDMKVAFEAPISNRFFADLAIGDVLIDINPSVTHNSTISFTHFIESCTEEECQDSRHAPRTSSYHHERFLEAEKNGKALLQYFDWMDEEVFTSIVRAKLHLDEHKAAARKCEVREISQQEANAFLKENHLLGAARGQSFCVGLFYEDELVHVNTYGRARLNKNFEWEAIRSCSKMNWHVQGGVQRCDKFFFTEKKPGSVVSYVDLALGPGATEAANPGWELIATNKPSATWAFLGGKSIMGGESNSKPIFLKDSAVRKLSADKLLGFEVGDRYASHHSDGSVFTNDDVLLAEGYVKVFDAGTRTFGWRLKASSEQEG